MLSAQHFICCDLRSFSSRRIYVSWHHLITGTTRCVHQTGRKKRRQESSCQCCAEADGRAHCCLHRVLHRHENAGAAHATDACPFDVEPPHAAVSRVTAIVMTKQIQNTTEIGCEINTKHNGNQMHSRPHHTTCEERIYVRCSSSAARSHFMTNK